MNELNVSLPVMVQLISGEREGLWPIVLLSLQVSAAATVLAGVLGLPLAAAVALFEFRGRQVLIAVLNALMGLPAVVVGLLVYLLLSRAGPLGSLGILFTPAAMVVAQTVLVLPLVAALSRQILEDALCDLGPYLLSLKASPLDRVVTILVESRLSLLTALLAGFGRAAAEVGAVMIVGGNIDGVTRTMTTAIALETSKGDLALALALGLILILLVLLVNACAQLIKTRALRAQGGGHSRE
jgi:tungstate transport system permease protein